MAKIQCLMTLKFVMNPMSVFNRSSSRSSSYTGSGSSRSHSRSSSFSSYSSHSSQHSSFSGSNSRYASVCIDLCVYYIIMVDEFAPIYCIATLMLKNSLSFPSNCQHVQCFYTKSTTKGNANDNFFPFIPLMLLMSNRIGTDQNNK